MVFPHVPFVYCRNVLQFMCCDRVGTSLIGLIRRILIFPKGNNVDHLSIYLDVADSTTLPYGWSRYAQFSLAMVNQVHSKYSIRKGTFTVLMSVVSFACLSFCHLRQYFFFFRWDI